MKSDCKNRLAATVQIPDQDSHRDNERYDHGENHEIYREELKGEHRPIVATRSGRLTACAAGLRIVVPAFCSLD
jgi:hypothetical protein